MEIDCQLYKYIKVFTNLVPESVLDNLTKICKESPHFKQAAVIGDDSKMY